MRANVGYQGLDADWNRVSHAAPCPICGGVVECRTHVEEEFACCVREASEWRLTNGGWLHRVERWPDVAAARSPCVTGERPPDASRGVVS